MNVVQRQDESARNTDFVLKIVPYTQSAVKKSRHRLEKSQSAPTANRLRVNTGVQLADGSVDGGTGFFGERAQAMRL